MTAIHRIEVPIPYPVKWINCYYIEDSTPTLIDTGINLPGSFETIASGIRSHGGDIRDIRRIIATHGHMDHIGLAGRIAEVSSAEVFVHPWETVRAYRPGGPLEEKRSDFQRFFLEAGVPYDTIPQLIDLIVERNKAFCSPLTRETPLNVSSRFVFDDFVLKAFHTPGHSPGSICLFSEPRGDLFTGDTLVPEVISNPSVECGGNGRGSGFVSIAAHHASLDFIEALPVKRVLPGHGASFRDHVRRVRKIRIYHERRTERVVKLLRNHKDYVNQYTVAHELFPELEGWDIFFGVSAARGHLNLLHSQGRVRRRQDGNQFVYQLDA